LCGFVFWKKKYAIIIIKNDMNTFAHWSICVIYIVFTTMDR
jgi:hypothetical protein